ncbi:hypothetical protein CLOBOL_05144 [Enterocloster bolteae ATCC BAA-613]|uniref:Uncharacterized protein n=1 Tax=Enterocloster bolteae (strain ATCC BAA-613 / DSM 15670 / CCUG 46953 / JCM 12243 / WAL 16351) TaxID=411902 RepID=A8RYJ5_ENTBW|nr:hypothetical protein CLOBOL_05144 [Enterocloster bolteae ATCC BAA-613]
MEKAEEFRAETAENSPYGQKGFPALDSLEPLSSPCCRQIL